MTANKSEKELAYIHDLYVAPDWGERFAALVDEHVEPPKRGRALYVASGTGGHALAIKERAGRDLALVCVDDSEERLELARVKAAAVKSAEGTEFRHAQLEELPFEDEAFELVVGDASLVAPERLPELLAEMARVAAPGATVALSVTTASSYGEFFSIYWEALANAGFVEEAAGIGSLIKALPTVSDVESLATGEALDDLRSWTNIEEFNFASGGEFLNAPLVEEFLLPGWLDALPGADERELALKEVERIIDAERQDMNFTLSVKATLVVGRKGE